MARKTFDPAQQDRQNQIADSAGEDQRKTTIANVYQTADRIITGRPVCVSARSINGAPSAWSSADGIVLNLNSLKTLTDSNLATMTGANFHELSHVLFTPRGGSLIVASVTDPEHPAFNILEDARIERLMISRHPSMKGFLVHTVADLILSGNVVSKWPLVAGRTYLPATARAAVKAAYTGTADVDEIERIAVAYSRLAFPGDEGTGISLVKEFYWLLYANIPPSPCGNRSNISQGQAESGLTQRKLQDDADTDDEEAEEQAAEDAEGGDGEEQATPGLAQRILDANEAMRQAQQDALEDKSVRSSINDTRRQITQPGNQRSRVSTPEIDDFRPFDANTMAQTRRVAAEVHRLIESHEPGWEIEQPGGRLNMAHVMAGRDFGEVFDRWDQGEEGVSLEVVLLVDSSWSMDGQPIKRASVAAAVLQRGLTSAGVVVSTYTFSTGLHGVYARGEKPQRIRDIAADDNTFAAQGLIEAIRVLRPSQARRKLVVMLTDGAFADTRRAEDAISLLQSEGVVIAVAFALSDDNRAYEMTPREAWEYYAERFRHGADVFETLEHASDLVPFTRSVVTSMLRTQGRS